MKQIGKRILSMLCVLTMVMSNIAMIVPGTNAEQIAAANEIDGISSEHLISIRDYSHFAYDANEGTNYVDDAEAYGGKAVCYSRANFDGGDFIALHRYESATGSDASIAQLLLADLKVNQGYQVYKFDYDVPANATENGVVYIMPNWQLNSSQLCKDFHPYAGKTVEVYLSMKVTGPAADGKYSVSVDRVALASVCKDYPNAAGTACTLCGKELEGGNTSEIVFLAQDITIPYASSGLCDSKVDDPDSVYGKAIKLSYAERYATGDAGLWKPMLYLPEQASLIYANNGSDTRLGMITGAELAENAAAGAYVTYTFSDLDLSGQNFVYLFDWSVQTRFSAEQKSFFEGKLVDMTVSMKVTGDVTGSDTANPPCYYIDCITYKDVNAHSHTCDSYTYENESQHTGTCSGCGETVKENHNWDAGVVTVEPTVDQEGEKVYTCSVCNGTKKEVLDKVGETQLNLTFLADDITLPYFTAGLCDSKVDDPDSAYGKAIKLSYAERYATGDAGLWKPMLYLPEQATLIYANDVSDTRLGMITGAELAENAASGVYITYTFSDLDLSGQNFVYLFDWSVQTRFSDEQKAFFEGKLVDMTVSMKVTGDVTGSDTANPPCYYIDCISYAEAAEHEHSCTSYTYLNEAQHSGTCSDCGETVKENHNWDEGVVTVEPTVNAEGEKVFTCSVCNGTKKQVLDKLEDIGPTIIFLADDITIPYSTSGVCDSKVDDPYSAHGKAVMLSYAERFATGDAALWKPMLYTEEQAMLIYANGGGDLRLGMITGVELAENSAAGEYVNYTFNDLNLSGKDFVYLFDWAVQARFSNVQKTFFADKLVNMTVSMKVTGDVTGNDAANPPAYYIDCIRFDAVEGTHVHSCASFTYLNEKVHSGTCSSCGETVKENHKWDEGVVTVEPTKDQTGEKVYTCGVCNGTRIQVLAKLEELGTTLTFYADDLTVPYFTSGLCDSVETDTKSAYGKAVVLSYADRFATGDETLWKAMLYTEEQAALIYANGGGDVRIGMITGAEMAENAAAGKYVNYKFSKLNLSGRDFVYLFDWAVQARFTDAHKAFFADKLVDMTISMKVTGDVTGQDAANPPVYYIDCIKFEIVGEEHIHQYAEGTYVDENLHSVTCTGCGETVKEDHKWDEGVVTVEPTSRKEGKKVFTCTVCGGTRTQVLPKKNDKLLIFLAGDLTVPYADSGLCDSKVNDPDSKYGMAVKLSYAERQGTGDVGLLNPMHYTEEQAMLIYANGGGDVRLGMITGEEMAKNANTGKYVTYKFSELNLSDKDFVYLFDWAVQAHFSDEQKEFLLDKLVDMTVSMKITGDVTADDKSNPPAYYIDYISFEIVGEKHTHRYTEGTYVDENQHSVVCTGCGKKMKEDHKWDEGVVTVEPTNKKTGKKLFTCTVCGGTKTQTLPKKNDTTLIFLAGDMTVPYAESGLCDAKVSDPNSKYGMAVKLSYAERQATGDSVLYNVMLYTQEQAMLLYSHGEKDVNLGMITGEELAKNAKAGKYVTYTFKHLDLDGQDFVYLFDWAVQTRFTEEQKAFFAEKWVDMTVSMRVTGDVTGNDAANPPVYYIDYISYKIVGENHTHRYTEGTYVDDDQHIGTCTGCGEKVKMDHEWDEGVIKVGPTEEKEGKKVYTCSVCKHTRTQILNKVTKDEIDEIPEEHLVSLRDYSSFATDENEGTTYVEDPDARNGMAVCYTGAKLSEHPFITINRYDVASGLEDGDPAMKIGGLSLSQVKVNKGYRVYKFTYNVPEETTEGNTFYIMSNWQLNSAEFCADFAAYAGKTVEVYLSMKVTGPSEDGLYSVFVDRIALASACANYAGEDGETCTLCGGSLLEQPAQMPITILAEDFLLPYAPTDSVVEDPDSEYGWAAKFSYKDRAATGDKGLCNSMIRDNGLSLGMYTYDGEENHLVGRITLNQLRNNSYAEKYKTYTFWNVALIPENSDDFAYLFDCWGLQLRFNESQLMALRGKRVDVTVSLKVTGNVSSTYNAPSYYIDYIQIAEASGRGCGHEDSAWTFVDDKVHNFACAICGQTWDEEHTWGEGAVVEGMPEGMLMYTCTGCRKSAIRGEETLPIVFLAENFSLPYGVAFGCDKVVDDPDSQFGKAVVISYADRLATGDKGLYEQLIKVAGQELRLYTCNGSDSKLIGGIDGADLLQNAKGGKYVTYEFKDIKVTDISFIYMFECWGLQARFSQEQIDAMQGKLINVALSMKVVGDPSDVNNPPAYYIESMIVSLSENQIVHEHTYNEYTSVDDNQHTCTCAECGEVLTENHKWDAGKIVKDNATGEDKEIIYTCTLCGATKTKVLGNQIDNNGQDNGPISNEILVWAISVGVADLAIVIFIIAMLKKRRKK